MTLTTQPLSCDCVSRSKRQMITVGIIDGRKYTGFLTKFSPLWQDFSLDPVKEEQDTCSLPLTLRAEEISYVAFYREMTLPLRPPQRAGMRKVRVHLVSGESFTVQVIMTTTVHPAGFYGYCFETENPYHTFFFYRHAVRTIEREEHIGALWIKEGRLDPADLHRGVAHQTTERRIGLGDILVERKQVEQTMIEQAVKMQQRKRMRLGEVLIESGLVTPTEIELALAEQRKRPGKKLGEILIKMGIVTEEEIAAALAKKFHMPFINLDEYPINPLAIIEVPPQLLTKHHFLPIDTNEKMLTVAIADPCVTEIYDLLFFRVKKKINEVLVTPSQLQKGLERWVGRTELSLHGMTEDLVVEISKKSEEPEELNVDLLKKEADETPIIRLVNQIILRGLQKKASDIHLLPQNRGLVLSYRINGDLCEETILDRRVQRQIVSRIKILAGMDIAERRLPQDGRIWLKHGKQEVEFRVSTIPNTFGESIVLRVLNKEMAVDLQTLGLREADRQRLLLLTHRPYGLLLATGPTGSGKSTTLFALLKEIVARPVHIITIEDPVESEIPGINQIQVHAKIGMTFARILRNILRHDPDVIMVGEMRDTETASIGIEAALTGHLLLSTLHTNTAVDTIIRLTDMGIPTYLVASALLGIISQILVKRLCPYCRRPVAPSDEIFKILEGMKFSFSGPLYEAGTCVKCDHTGYNGRVMLYEFLEINDTMRAAIHKGLTGTALQEVAVAQGMIPKAHHALDLATQGVISRDDLIRALL